MKLTFALSPVLRHSASMLIIEAVCLIGPQCTYFWNVKKNTDIIKGQIMYYLSLLSKVNSRNFWTGHSALKLEQKCNFKSAKTHLLLFQKWQKINFCTRKKIKIAFLVVLNFFEVQKLIFCHFWNCKKCVFLLLNLHFFPILVHCAYMIVSLLRKR